PAQDAPPHASRMHAPRHLQIVETSVSVETAGAFRKCHGMLSNASSPQSLATAPRLFTDTAATRARFCK
ncbi:MAG: hypothetical protein VYB74_05205, partial [Cyanobacteriota bacterium]|nr:hypothetical protein [Cyanobacteriota bacterium]